MRVLKNKLRAAEPAETSPPPIPEEEGANAPASEDLTEKWGDFLSDEEEEDEPELAVTDELETPAPEVPKEPEAEAPTKEEVVEEGKAPEPEPVVAETPAPEVPLEEPSAVEQPVGEAVEKPPVEEPQVPAKTPEEMEALRSQAQSELRKSYELNSDEAEQMLSEPEKVLPALAARVHMQVYEQVVQGVIAQLPQMVSGIIAQDRQVRSSEDSFFERWPDLKEHKQQVAQVATLWRQLNPQATTQDAVENIGKHAMIALGYTPGAKPGAQAPPAVVEVPGAPPPPAPLGAATPPVPVRKSSNQFEVLADELLTEEEEY